MIDNGRLLFNGNPRKRPGERTAMAEARDAQDWAGRAKMA
jgi:hypothetical protein